MRGMLPQARESQGESSQAPMLADHVAFKTPAGQAGRWAGRQEGRKEGMWAGRRAGGQAGRWAGGGQAGL